MLCVPTVELNLLLALMYGPDYGRGVRSVTVLQSTVNAEVPPPYQPAAHSVFTLLRASVTF